MPKGNPDHIASANPDKFGVYDIAELTDLTGDKFMTVHGGYDPVYATEDPDRVVPLDALRAIEKEGGIWRSIWQIVFDSRKYNSSK